jgi:Family of unknown function (DUF5996)
MAGTRPAMTNAVMRESADPGTKNFAQNANPLSDAALLPAGGGEALMQQDSVDRDETWPALPYAAWRDTAANLHLWTQVIGKVRLACTPWLNHAWHVALYVTSRGLTTSPIPYGDRSFELEFDFQQHQLILISDGEERSFPLRPISPATFYALVMQLLAEHGFKVRINPIANEIAESIRLDLDHQHRAYDPDYANRFWRVLRATDRVLKEFRTGFLGKASPVHFFWGSFDIAVTRFSGRAAPPHPGGVPHLPDSVARESYSHEVSSAGFWPGDARLPEPVFYAYAYPVPPGFPDAAVEPPAAYYHDTLGEFVLPYETVRTSADPEQMLLRFLGSTYAAAADLAGWDRAALECEQGRPRVPRIVSDRPVTA